MHDVTRHYAFLQQNALPKDSLCRKCFVCLVDISISVALVLAIMRIVDDQEYWQRAPYPLHVFILTQYLLFALVVRLPLCQFKQKTSTVVFCLYFLVQTGNTWFGLYLMYRVRSTATTTTTT